MLRERSLDDPMLDIGRNLIWERGFPNDMGKQKTGTPYFGMRATQSEKRSYYTITKFNKRSSALCGKRNIVAAKKMNQTP